MMRSMYSGVAGLRNHQTRMDVLGNNIANVNTTGYKKSRVVFKDTFYQASRGASRPTTERGGTNPMAVGLGMTTASIDQIHTPAPTTTTNKTTDMAVDGNGYFAVNAGSNRYYTRAGAFDFDTDGNLVSTSNGYKVQGWTTGRIVDPATGNWTVPTNAELGNISLLSFKTLEPNTTTEMKFSGNLDSTTNLNPAANEVQTLIFGTLPSAGMFRLQMDGQTTAMIDANGTHAQIAARIQTALEALSNVGTGNVAVATQGATGFQLTFQGALANTDVAQVQFLDGSLALNGTGPTITTTNGSAAVANEVVGLDLDGATGGTYTLNYNGNTTAPIAWNATNVQVQAALIAADPSLNGNINVIAPGPGVYEYQITFGGTLANSNRPDIVMDDTLLTGGAGNGVATVTTQGLAAFNETVGINLNGATQGYYSLTYGGAGSTASLASNSTDAQIQAALIAAYPALNGNISVAGGVVTFINGLGNQDVANALTITGVAAYNGVNPTTSTVTPAWNQLATPTAANSVITSRDIFDSLGNKRTVYFRFIKYNIDNTIPNSPVSNWACDMSLNPLFETAAGYNAATDMVNVDVTTGAPTASLPNDPRRIVRLTGLNFDKDGIAIGGQPDPSPLVLTVDRDSVSARDITFDIDFNSINQYNGKSTAWAESQNGYKAGSLTSYSIGTDGTITGIYDNDETRSLARVALFTFENPAGLKQNGASLFTESSNSGLARQGAPGEGGTGAIIPGSLEMSNVDLSEEFTDMIVTQRGFQANSRIITTSDEMLQELVNLKR